MSVLSLRAQEWIAWAINVRLNLSPPLRPVHVREILEPRFDTVLLDLLDPWDPILHPLIVRAVTREAKAAEWIATRSADPQPPPLERRDPYVV